MSSVGVPRLRVLQGGQDASLQKNISPRTDCLSLLFLIYQLVGENLKRPCYGLAESTPAGLGNPTEERVSTASGWHTPDFRFRSERDEVILGLSQAVPVIYQLITA